MSGITINKKKNIASLRIDTRFYGYLTVVVAAAEFSESLWVQLDGAPEGYLTVRLAPKTKDVNLAQVSREFFNYMLDLMAESLEAMSVEKEA